MQLRYPRWRYGRRVVSCARSAALLLCLIGSTALHSFAQVVICVPDDTIDASCSAGQGQTTIQAAIDAAVTAVDTVLVGAGTYNENLTLGKNINLRGAQADLDACGRTATETVISASGSLLTLQAGVAGAVINGFHFSGGANAIIAPSASGPLDGIAIRNNRITGFTDAGIASERRRSRHHGPSE